MRWTIVPVLLACLFSIQSAAAQEAASTGPAAGTEIYPPSFFASAAPSTAMDMINRLPGFRFDGGDNSRGFSGNAGNVLIDGRRPTVKTDNLYDILSRLVAADVDHIEIIRGSAPGIDMQGRTVLANVVRKTAASTNIVVTAGENFFSNGRTNPNGRVEYSRTEGDRSYQASIQRDSYYNDDIGAGSLVDTDAAQNVIRTPEIKGADGGALGVNGTMKSPLAGGDFGANVTLRQSYFNNANLYDYATGAENITSGSRDRNGEVGTSYERKLGAFTLETIFLQRVGFSNYAQREIAPSGNSVFTSVTDTGETIGHVTLRYPLSDALSFEGGTEVAYNFLTGRSNYTEDSSAVALPSSQVTVTETRGEIFSQANWRIFPALTLETGVSAEFSTIGETGDINQSRSLFYPKPRALLSWSLDPDSQLRLRVEHKVGQLDFGNFVSSANLVLGNVTAGNPQLKPDQRWQYETSYERHFWDKGVITLTLLHQQITGILDDMPIVTPDGTLDTFGNIGDGRADQAELDATVPLDRFGILGGLLSGSAYLRDSAVRDPVTGLTRRLSYEDRNSLNFSLSQDLPAWKSTWNISYSNGWDHTGYLVTQTQRYSSPANLNISWNYKPDPNIGLNIGINHLLGVARERQSIYYDGPRNNGAVTGSEFEFTRARPMLFVTLRRAFE